MRLNGRIAVVTGAAGGIGAAAVEALAAKGCRVIATGRTLAKLEERKAASAWSNVEIEPLDVTSETNVNQVLSNVEKRYGSIDILVNNAGFGIFQAADESEMRDIEAMMDVNYFGTVRCIRAVLPGMKRRRLGAVVNVASMAGKVGTAKAAGYAATKHAVLGYTHSLRQELAGTGITVSAVNPGPVDTGFFGIADPGGGYADRIRWLMIRPEQVASRIVRAAETGAREYNIPALVSVSAKAYLLMPGLLDAVAGKLMNRK